MPGAKFLARVQEVAHTRIRGVTYKSVACESSSISRSRSGFEYDVMTFWLTSHLLISTFLRQRLYTFVKLYGKIVIRIGWVKYVVSKRAIAVTKNIKVLTLNVKHQILFIQLKFSLCNKNISLPKTNTTITHLHSLRWSIFSHFERSARETLTTSSGKTLCEKMLI